MLLNLSLSSLEETADRFRKSPEFIWNMSLQFNTLLRPELGDNGRIAYSEQQRHIIGRIIRMREEGMTESEIRGAVIGEEPPAQVEQPARARCPSSEVCRRNFRVIADQMKLMHNQINRLKSELSALQNDTPATETNDPFASLPANQPYIDKKRMLD